MQNIIIILFLVVSFSANAQKQRGEASFYDQKFEGKTTASEEIFSQNSNTAAHKTLPFNSMVKVTNLKNGKASIIRINDRGPFIRGRIIDVTSKTAKELGFFEEGTTTVEIELLSEAATTKLTTEEIKEQQTETKPKQEKDPSTTVREEIAKERTQGGETIKKENTPAVLNSVKKEGASTPSLSVKADNEIIEVFALEVKSLYQTFFGVQIASFTDATYLMRFTSEIKTSYTEKVIVLSKQQNDRKLFTLVLGQFENRLGAENFSKKIKVAYPDAFIVEVNN